MAEILFLCDYLRPAAEIVAKAEADARAMIEQTKAKHDRRYLNRASPERKVELAAAKAVILGEAHLTIDDLLQRPDRTRTQILNAVGQSLASIAGLAVGDVERAREGFPLGLDADSRFDRALKLHRELGRILEEGRRLPRGIHDLA